MINDSHPMIKHHFLQHGRRFLQRIVPALPAMLLPLMVMAQTAPPAPDMEIRAQLVAVHHPVISSTIAGRIDNLKLKAGDFFKKGETLVRIDCTAQQSELVLAETILARKQKILHINHRLNQLGSVSELEMAVSESEVKEARAGVAFHEAVVNQCTIRAPFSGRVVRKFVNRYQYVGEGEPIFEVIDHRKLEIEMIVPSIWLRW
ncbi:MAG TPA: HlyD family efflux transporter periplasmic adaptor subunit, partial [Tichowtungia sp.]|nr:HlyD family efflux transporter periplasmic adaptor subunit [Tichowtungia sp.]